MTRLFRSWVIGFFATVAALASVDLHAESLREIFEKKGRDYLLANAKTISAQLDDQDKFFLAMFLIGNLRGSEAPDILVPLAQKGDLGSIGILAVNFGTGKEGFEINESQASLWAARLETLALGADEKQREGALGTLCEIYRDWNHVLYDKDLAIKYCEAYYGLPGVSRSSQAYAYLSPESVLFDPARGMSIYGKCLAEGDAYCKMNYAWQGRESMAIAKLTTKRQLFEYAAAALGEDSAAGMNNLGVFYLEGFGTPRDPGKALELFEKAASQNKDHALYNLLEITFFRYADWKDAPKDADEAMFLISYYEYFVAEADRFDSVPFREWVVSKGRIPVNDSEFGDFLRERAKAGSDTSACMLAGHLLKAGDLAGSLRYAEMGRRSKNIKVKRWCEREMERVDVRRSIAP